MVSRAKYIHQFVQAFDSEDATISDAALIKFLSASGPWLAAVTEVDLKQCHYVSATLLAFLCTACPKLRKLAASRWAEHSALAEIAQFPALEVGVELRGTGMRRTRVFLPAVDAAS